MVSVNESDGYLLALKSKLIFMGEAGSNEYIFRCPYCGDSSKKNKGHFYVNIDKHTFNCFRQSCGARGSINSLLDFLNLNEYKIKYTFGKNRIPVRELSSDMFNISDVKHNVDLFDTYHNKIDYLCDRLDCKPINLLELPLVLDFENFVYENRFKIKNSDKILNSRYLEKMDNNYVGFYSYHKQIVVFRTIEDTPIYRYKIVKVDRGDPDYFILSKNKHDSLSTKTELNVVLGEGTFDVALPFVDDMFPSADIYVAALGATKMRSCVQYLTKEFGCPLNITLLCDSDYLNKYKTLFKSINNICNSFTTVINTLGKDTGAKPIELRTVDHFEVLF